MRDVWHGDTRRRRSRGEEEPAGGDATVEPGFSDAVDAGKRARRRGLDPVALIVGAVLPWLPVVLVLVLLLWLARRLVRRGRRPPTPPIDTPPAVEQEERQPEPVG